MIASPTHSFVQANGLRFHLAEVRPLAPVGQAAPLALFLHGFPECWYSWRHQMPAVAEAGYRAWAVDMRGYNLSDKPRGIRAYHLLTLARDVKELIRAAGVERAVVIGHDWGGIVAWRVAMEYPELVSKLVILNVPHPGRLRAGLWNPRQLLKSSYIGFFQIPWLPEFLMSHNARRVAEGIRRSAARPEMFSEEDLRVYADAIAQPGAMHAAINYYRAYVRWGLWLPIKPIRAPTLMIWGEQDVALRKELTYGTAEYVERFRIHYLPDSGHWVQQEASEQVNRVLIDFISSER